MEDYLVTEFLVPHEEINKIHPGTANSLRFRIIKEGSKPSILTYVSIRFGTSQTKVVDNLSAGGLFSIINLKTGFFQHGYRKENGKMIRYEKHPDTGIDIKGYILNWDKTVSKIKEIADYLGQLTWMGIDVVITDDCFKILEINSHQDITWHQYFQPLLEGDPSTDFFKRKLKEKSLLK